MTVHPRESQSRALLTRELARSSDENENRADRPDFRTRGPMRRNSRTGSRTDEYAASQVFGEGSCLSPEAFGSHGVRNVQRASHRCRGRIEYRDDWINSRTLSIRDSPASLRSLAIRGISPNRTRQKRIACRIGSYCLSNGQLTNAFRLKSDTANCIYPFGRYGSFPKESRSRIRPSRPWMYNTVP